MESEFSSYFEQYLQDHNLFIKQGIAKHSPNLAIQYFINIPPNPSSENVSSKPNIRIASFNSSIAFVALHFLANLVVIQARAKPGTKQA